MRVMVCLGLVDTGIIKYNNNSLLISVDGHGTVCLFLAKCNRLKLLLSLTPLI